MSNLFPFLGLAMAIGRQHEHGPQAGGNTHPRATSNRNGFMSKKQARELRQLVQKAREPAGPYPGLVPTPRSADFRLPLVDSSRIVLDAEMLDGPIYRADSFDDEPARYSLTARPGWLVVQSPQDGIARFAAQIAFEAVTGKQTWLVPCFADMPQNVYLSPDIFALQTFAIGQTDGDAIDGNNLVSVQISQSGGVGELPQNSWDIRFRAFEDGSLVHSEAVKVAAGAPPVAVVFVKDAETTWHIEVLLAGNSPAHVSEQFTLDITPDRFSWLVQTEADADHAIVRGIQGLYTFDTDGLVL